MQVSRVYSPETLNRVVNREDILPYVAPGYDSYDLTEFLEDRRNIALCCEQAYAIFQQLDEGVYEGHYFFLSPTRGKKTFLAAKKILNEMFTIHSARTIHGLTPRKFRAARYVSRALGFEPVGDSRNNVDVDCIHYVLSAEKWAQFSESVAESKHES